MSKNIFNKKLDTANANLDLALTKIEKLTALWALSESTLGGVLHALRFPFRGMIISSAAIILISMIATFTASRGKILKSTIVVIAAKAIISPHTPITAYFSVLLQGILGELFFITRRFRFILSLMFGITVSLLNGFQKVLVLTIIYGTALWSTINDFLNYIVKDVIKTSQETDYSLIIISLYVCIHLAAGILTGILAYRIPREVTAKLREPGVNFSLPEVKGPRDYSSNKKSVKLFKPTSLLVFIMGITIIIISYFYPLADRFNVTSVIVMLVRAILIMVLWFHFISPLIKNYILTKLSGTHSRYSMEVNILVSTLPAIRTIIYSIWKSTTAHKGLSRIYHFILSSLIYTLADQNNSTEKTGL